jgi:LEA14-like dessication related protein
MTLKLWTCFSVAKVGSALMELLHSLEAPKVEGLQNRVEASSHSSQSPHSIKTINNNRFPCRIKAWELQMHISICSQLLLCHPQNLRLEHHPLAKLGHL